MTSQRLIAPGRLSLALLALLLLGACAGSGGSFPSLKPRPGETPRVIEAPGGSAPPALSAEEQAGLQADMKRLTAALDAATRDMAETGRALDAALAAARTAAVGSEAWSNAQMALSRYDLARSPLGEIEAGITPLLRQVDSLPADSPDRQAVESLGAAAARANAEGQRRAEAANRALAR
jgi:hypothetical protein